MATTASSFRLGVALVLAASVWWLATPDTSAHAAYESSVPAFAERLEASPSEITIRFTQELFRRDGANTMELVQTQSSDLLAEYEIGPVSISNDDRHVMSARVPVELPPGRYAVRWTNLSAEDGDEDSGWLPFYVRSDPEPWQIDEDRQLAAELLIPYPGDEPAQSAQAEPVSPRAPTVVRTESEDGGSIGVGPIVWLAVGIVAALILGGSLGFHRGRRRSD